MFNILVGTQKISQIELPSCDKNNLSNTIFLLSKMGFFFFLIITSQASCLVFW